MYIYFDTNGTIKEIVNDKSIRQGSTEANKIYCYIEGNPTIDDIWYMQKLPSGETSNEVSFKNSTVTRAIPYDAKRDMRYFKDFEQYKFYVVTLNTFLTSQKGLNIATIRVSVDNTIWALGELTFNVQENVINVDNGITQSQYDYLLLAYASRTLSEQTGSDLDYLIDDKINAKIGDLASGSPKVFDTEANIEALHDDEGIAVATDTGYIYVWNDTQEQYISTGLLYVGDISLYYTKTETDTLLNAKANASDVYTKTQSDALLANKADKSDTYTKTECNNTFVLKSSNDYELSKIKSRLDYMDKIRNKYIEPYNLIDKSVVLANSVFKNAGWNGNQGVIQQGDGNIYIFPIEPSTRYYLTQITNVLYNAVFYDADMNFITHLYPTAPSFNNAFNSPVNAYYIGFMYYSTYESTMYLGLSDNYRLWQNGEKFKLTSQVNTDFSKNKNHIISDTITTLDTNNLMSLDVSNCKYNYTIGFYAYIDDNEPTFEVCIAHGKNSAWAGSFITIDNTNLKVYSRQNSQDNLISTYGHNLTITKFIDVTISINDNKAVAITINTVGGSYSTTSIWIGCQGNISASLNNGQLSNATLTFYCEDYNKEIWLFGDSYFDFWPSISKGKKFNKGMFDAFGGRTSSQAYASLQKCLDFNTPKYVVWCMGMNNSDTSSSANSEWSTIFDNLKLLCKIKHITLVLATIPTTTTMNNKYKNILIRTSGYRYIDIAKAVGSNDDTGSWYSGLLSSDNIHPTTLGSNVIANYVDIMLPELYSN